MKFPSWYTGYEVLPADDIQSWVSLLSGPCRVDRDIEEQVILHKNRKGALQPRTGRLDGDDVSLPAIVQIYSRRLS